MIKTTSSPRWLAAGVAVAAFLAVPAAGSAKVLHFKGRATGPKHDTNMRITFDIRASKGKPRTISNVHITKLDYRCENDYATERDLQISGKGHFNKRKRFEITKKELPPGFFNDIYGRFLYPKKGVRKKPTVKGFLSSEFGYGRTRSTYNCLGAESFIATRRG